MLTLRRATVEDAPLLRRWDEEPHVVASDPTSDWQWETELGEDWPWREQLVAEVDGMPIGFVQIIDPAEEVSRYWGDVPANLRAIDIWIGEAAYLGRGYGTRMMRLGHRLLLRRSRGGGDPDRSAGQQHPRHPLLPAPRLQARRGAPIRRRPLPRASPRAGRLAIGGLPGNGLIGN